jgi:hypothetical protein
MVADVHVAYSCILSSKLQSFEVIILLYSLHTHRRYAQAPILDYSFRLNTILFTAPSSHAFISSVTVLIISSIEGSDLALIPLRRHDKNIYNANNKNN